MEAGLLSARHTSPRTRAAVRSRALTVAPVIAITLLGAALRLASFGRVGPNPFYDAAVRSMTLSWHNLFYGAFEPGGQVSIDKIPVDLWLQVASVKLFGFSGVATRVPEVVAGILAIPLLYDLVRRLFGRAAGLGAAVTLAVLPTAILTAHSDTMDSVMMALDVLCAWLIVVGAQSRRVWPVVAAGAVLGLAFEVKLFQGLIAAPALALLALVALDFPRWRKVAALAGAAAAFVAVSLSWIVAASTTPLSGRPWPIGSTDGTIWSVVFGFNGIDRLRGSASPAALKLDPPGALRFFRAGGHDYAATVGTTLLAALLLGAIALVAVAATRARGRSARPQRLTVAGAVFFGTWLVSGAALLSHMQRFQPRYLEAVTPAIAAVVGVGTARIAGQGGRLGAAALAVCGAALAVAGALLVGPPAWAIAVALAGAAACGVLAVAPGARRARAVIAFGLVATLAVPTASALTVARQHRSDAGLPSRLSATQVASLSRFLIAHQHGARYELVSPTVARAAPLIVHDGRPVLMLTSLQGRPLLGPDRLARLVAAGEVRYAMLGGGGAPVLRWAKAHAHDVSAAAGLPRGQLYRLSSSTTTG
jgi:4-amino-4-deoxy-L-arabinose transferase-like glycosyltransferase